MLESMIKTGTVVTRHDLTLRGFVPRKLAFRTVDFSCAYCEWDTIGVVPDSAGLYAFVLTNDVRPGELRVAYVGKTKNLRWSRRVGCRATVVHEGLSAMDDGSTPERLVHQ
jgi:hypothetical protein